MKLKSLLLIVALLAAASIAVMIARRPAAPLSADARIDQPLLSADLAEKAAQIRFTDAGKTVTVVKLADGTWSIPAYYDFPANFGKIARSISDLTDAKLTRLVTTNPDRIARLEFKDSQIALLDASGKELWNVTLGKANESGGRFVRFGSEPKAYLTSLNAWLDTEPKNWARPELLNLKPEDIAQLELPLEGAPPVIVSRDKKESLFAATNLPAGQKLKTERVTSALASLTSLAFTETNDLTDANAIAAKAHQRVYKLTTFDGKTYTVALGRKPEEKKIKPPTTDPAALGKATDFAATGEAKPPADALAKLQPEFETIPAGPVFVVVSSSDDKAPLNALMQKRAFQVGDYVFTSLPQKTEDLFEPTSAPSSAAPVSTAAPHP